MNTNEPNNFSHNESTQIDSEVFPSPKDLGIFLKDLRLRKGYSLERLSRETKITLNILKKIEENDLTNLPNIIYIKGFVQNVLKLLNTPYTNEISVLINASFNQKSLIKDKNILLPNEPENLNENSSQSNSAKVDPNKKNLLLTIKSPFNLKFLIGTLLIFIAIAIYQFIDVVNEQISKRYSKALTVSENHSNQNAKDILKIENRLITDQYTNSSNREIKKTTTSDLNVTPVTTEIKKINNEAFPTNIPSPANTVIAEKPIDSLTSNISQITPVSEPTNLTVESNKTIKNLPYVNFKKIQTLNFNTVENFPEDELNVLYPKSERSKMISGKQNLYIIGQQADCWISYKVDGNSPRSTLLKKGNSLTLSGNKIFLNVGNTDAVEIFYNGKITQYLSNKGVKSFILPKEDAPNHYLPLFVGDETGKTYFYDDYKKSMMPPPTEPSSKPLPE